MCRACYTNTRRLTPSARSRAALLLHAPLTLLRALHWLAAQPCGRGALADGACCTVLCLGAGFPDVSLSILIDTEAGRACVPSCLRTSGVVAQSKYLVLITASMLSALLECCVAFTYILHDFVLKPGG